MLAKRLAVLLLCPCRHAGTGQGLDRSFVIKQRCWGLGQGWQGHAAGC